MIIATLVTDELSPREYLSALYNSANYMEVFWKEWLEERRINTKPSFGPCKSSSTL